jgi:hypothetical protein
MIVGAGLFPVEPKRAQQVKSRLLGVSGQEVHPAQQIAPTRIIRRQVGRCMSGCQPSVGYVQRVIGVEVGQGQLKGQVLGGGLSGRPVGVLGIQIVAHTGVGSRQVNLGLGVAWIQPQRLLKPLNCQISQAILDIIQT